MAVSPLHQVYGDTCTNDFNPCRIAAKSGPVLGDHPMVERCSHNFECLMLYTRHTHYLLVVALALASACALELLHRELLLLANL